MTSIAGEAVVPNVQYTVRILASNGMYSTHDDRARAERLSDRPDEDVHSRPYRDAGAMPVLTVKVVNASGVVQPNAAVTVERRAGLEHPAHRHD